ncbi:MAG: nicotinate-nucleotide diphosphorylase (carboxylating), partial [Armatimonadota bacterium]|nr:nicotinate-nucleotide diphosphorylase (carboxylating) [Armatimonadota bacterium]
MYRAVMERAVAAALAEDIGDGDITAEAVVPAEAWAAAIVVAKDAGILAGLPLAEATFRGVDPTLEFRALLSEGASVDRGVHVLHVEGSARSILTAERTALNFLQRLSGIATASSAYVAACAGTGARIVDTRKTAPGLRALDKYAVRIGGASNHRA